MCKEDYTVGEEVRQLPCNHFFHSSCIVPWLELVSTDSSAVGTSVQVLSSVGVWAAWLKVRVRLIGDGEPGRSDSRLLVAPLQDFRCPFGTLAQALANSSPQMAVALSACANEVLLGHSRAHLFIDCLAAFVLRQQSRTAATQAVGGL